MLKRALTTFLVIRNGESIEKNYLKITYYKITYYNVLKPYSANINIRQEVIHVPFHEKFKKLVELLYREDIKDGRTIVFMNKRRRCENVALQLGFKFGKKGSRNFQNKKSSLTATLTESILESLSI